MNNSGQKKARSDYCWNINEGIPSKFSNKCKFIERCKYCHSAAHRMHICPKLQKKTGGEIANAGKQNAQPAWAGSN